MDNLIGHLHGMRVMSSPMAMVTAPVREHVHKGTQSLAYHNRIQKKWDKRFGTKQVPGIYMMNVPNMMFGGTEKVIMAHPAVIEKLKDLPTGYGVDESNVNKQYGKQASRYHEYGQSPLKEVFRPKGIIDLDGCA